MAKPRNLDEVIRRYETMPASQVRAELAKRGIDPQPTIDAVQKLVDDKIGKRRHRPRPV